MVDGLAEPGVDAVDLAGRALDQGWVRELAVVTFERLQMRPCLAVVVRQGDTERCAPVATVVERQHERAACQAQEIQPGIRIRQRSWLRRRPAYAIIARDCAPDRA